MSERAPEPIEGAVELRGIVKRFPGIVANDDIDLTVARGEVHALLGENGAGKTTLMSILSGAYRPDAGSLWIRGQSMSFRSPKQAIEAGIGMVHQHFRLVQPLSVAENVLLGAPSSFRLADKATEGRVAELAGAYGIQVNPSAKVWQLSVGEQQRVEILKALFREASVLILDEPTAVLTPQEATHLFSIMRKIASEGRAVIFISHKLDEVMAVADRVTVLRAGRKVATLAVGDSDKSELARLMVGREVMFRVARSEHPAGAPRLNVTGLVATGDLGLPALRDVTLEVRAGEILGVAGVAGNGQRELTEVIAGLRTAGSGTVTIGGRDLSAATPAERIAAGLGYVPEDRLGTGLVPSLGCIDNVMLKRMDRFAKGVFINKQAAETATSELVDRFEVQTSSLQAPMSLMSGGNIQKLLLARELSAKPEVLVVAQPTAGLDVGATEAIRQLLLEQRDAGVAVLLVSEDLDELLSLCDRIAVMYEGKVMGVVDAGEADRERIGLMMAGTSGAPA
ncbi:MAG: ABC transporter ATP-binding protein [Actinomycetota bacterium]|nr:ABC transporter ATP-binding protein [Actinomycetota bacterium]